MHFIFGNYGDNTVAVIQWAFNNNLCDVYVIHVNTGMSRPEWEDRMERGQNLATQYRFTPIGLQPTHNLEALVRDRGSFPSAKYQWCPTFLKALPLLAFMDEIDPACEGTVILGSMRIGSRLRQNLPEFIDQSEHYGERKVWHPLYNITLKARNELVQQTGMPILSTRSYECFPCIHSKTQEIKWLPEDSLNRIAHLEQDIGETLFNSRYPNLSIKQVALLSAVNEQDANPNETIEMGCGSFYACGE